MANLYTSEPCGSRDVYFLKEGRTMKNVAVIVSGAPAGNNVREVEVPPGVTAGDVLRAINLVGYLLSREGSAQAFAAEEPLYPALENGEKLRATPIAEVGRRFFDGLRCWFVGRPRVRLVDRNAETVPTVPLPPPTLPNRRRVRSAPDQRSLRDVRGWRREGKKLVGAYRVPRRGSCAGEILLGKQPQFFIVNPPQELLRGSHAACFRSRGGQRYYIHFGMANPEIDSGIVAIERLLADAYRIRTVPNA